MKFEELYDRYFSKVYNYVRYHVGLPAEADDITGRIFESALGNFETYDVARGPVQAWLFTIARNAVIDWTRLRNRRNEVALDDAGEREGAEPRMETALERKEEAGMLLEAAAELKRMCRQEWFMRTEFEELDVKQECKVKGYYKKYVVIIWSLVIAISFMGFIRLDAL